MANTRAVNLRQHPYDVYIGRARRGESPTRWGNPFELGRAVTRQDMERLGPFGDRHGDLLGRIIDRETAIEMYRSLLDCRLLSGDLKPQDFEEVYGAAMGCFCKPKDCHGDVIAQYAEWFHERPEANEGPSRGWTPNQGGC